MTTLQSENDCQSNDPNNLFPIMPESIRFPLDNSIPIIFTGVFNGVGVEIRSADEMALLHHMGCFGKGSQSRSKPKAQHNNDTPSIMRNRQFLKRLYWYKKFESAKESPELDTFLCDIDELTSKIINDTDKVKKDVIDLISSEDESEDNSDYNIPKPKQFDCNDKTSSTVVLVPNSDSEGDNYFANIKPACCINKIKIEEKLLLTLQEAFFLLYGLGCLHILNQEKLMSIEQCWEVFSGIDVNFVFKYVVYHYYRSKGYIVKPGIKFGGDYLLYKEGPGINHADYIVVIRDNDKYQNWISVLGHVRMAVTTVKSVIIAEVIQPQETVKLPEDLSAYKVREMLFSRQMPVLINDEID